MRDGLRFVFLIKKIIKHKGSRYKGGGAYVTDFPIFLNNSFFFFQIGPFDLERILLFYDGGGGLGGEMILL